MKKIFYILAIILTFNASAHVINTINLSTNMLMPFKKHSIHMDYSRAYMGQPMIYNSVLMKPLLKYHKVQKGQIVEMIAADDFSVFIPSDLLLQTNPKKSVAFLAIEPKEKWPKLSNGTDASAGPFQIIWTNPSYSHISDEYWAWSVVRMVVHDSYPKDRLVQAPITKDKMVLNGYHVYVSHCASCHNINHIGKASIGPEFSAKINPLSFYPGLDIFQKFVRNPSQFRKGRMSGSSVEGLSNEELGELYYYFKWLSHS